MLAVPKRIWAKAAVAAEEHCWEHTFFWQTHKLRMVRCAIQWPGDALQYTITVNGRPRSDYINADQLRRWATRSTRRPATIGTEQA